MRQLEDIQAPCFDYISDVVAATPLVKMSHVWTDIAFCAIHLDPEVMWSLEYTNTQLDLVEVRFQHFARMKDEDSRSTFVYIYIYVVRH